MKELLTGKCKYDFEKWYAGIKNPQGHWYAITNFYQLTFSMQYGVYLEFFDSADVMIWIEYLQSTNQFVGTVKDINTQLKVDILSMKPLTRQEAQQQAIIKANTIYNERH